MKEKSEEEIKRIVNKWSFIFEKDLHPLSARPMTVYLIESQERPFIEPQDIKYEDIERD